MESIDLGDRRGLIDLIYGTPTKDNQSLSSVNTATPLTQNKDNHQKEKKKSSKVSCSFPTALMIFLLVCAAIFLSYFAAYWFTKTEYEKRISEIHYVPQPRVNLSMDGSDILYEEEEPREGPTAEELALPTSLVPIWYNLTLKAYLPDYVPIDDHKESTTDAHLLIKMKVVADTDKIVLNSGNLTFPANLNKFQILTDKASRKRRAEKVEKSGSSNSSEVESSEMFNKDEMATMAGEASSTTTKTTTTTTAASTTTEAMTSGLTSSGIKVKNLKLNNTLQKLTLELDQPLKAGQEVVLKFPYNGQIGDSLNGLFASKYLTKSGEKRTIAATHMQPTYARNVVPSFDEPQLKAVWKVTVIHPNGTVVRANGETEEDAQESGEDGWLQTSFKETGPISTYLTALTITDFVNNKAASKSGAEIRVWTKPDAINSTAWALETAVKIVDFLEQYFDIPMEYKKQDLFAIPDFEAGAMENPGLLMFRENTLLYDETVDDLSRKEKVVRELSHEISHQWFGNLVTLSGWDSLWLNEAFARQMEYFVSGKILEGAVDEHQLEIVLSLEKALQRDAQSSSHPLTMHVETAEDAYENFDLITYEKGAAVIRMIKNIIGEEAFSKGIKSYLNGHKHGNANYTDLWQSLQSAVPSSLKSWDGSLFNVADFANKWILQMGYPVLDVYRIDAHTVEITQRRFKNDNLTPEKAKFRNALYWYKWDVPLFMDINREKQDLMWLHEALRLPLNLTDRLIINGDSSGYYRVNYDATQWQQLADNLQSDYKSVSTNTRARLISDAFALAQAGQLPYETVLNLTSYLDQETEYIPTQLALQGLLSTYKRIQDSDEGDEFKKNILKTLQPLAEKIDVSSGKETDLSKLFEISRKSDILEAICEIDSTTCGKKTQSTFNSGLIDSCKDSSFSSSCSKVAPTSRRLVYCDGVARGDEEVFHKLYNFAQHEVSSGERDNVMRALGCSKEPSLLRRLLRDAIKKDSPISKQDIQSILESMNSHPVGNLVATNFILDNWKDITEKLSEDRDILSLVLRTGLSVTNEREIKQLERFLMDHPHSTHGLSAFKTALEQGRSRVNWQKKSRPQLEKILNKSEL